jgi:bifunctional non-homologous end joining protein LigD
MSRISTLPKRLQPMLATLTNAPFDDAEWIFEDKYDGFRMVAKIASGKVTLYSRNGRSSVTAMVKSQKRSKA